jgi:hypothetical protein
MSCWHGRHGCGPWYDEPYAPGWYRADDWPVEMPRRGPARRYVRVDPASATDDLETRLEELHDEVRRIEAQLRSLRDAGITASDAP